MSALACKPRVAWDAERGLWRVTIAWADYGFTMHFRAWDVAVSVALSYAK